MNTTPTLGDLFAEHYVTAGSTGREILQAIYDDYANGRLSDPDHLADLEATEADVLREIVLLTERIVNAGVLDYERGLYGGWKLSDR